MSWLNSRPLFLPLALSSLMALVLSACESTPRSGELGVEAEAVEPDDGLPEEVSSSSITEPGGPAPSVTSITVRNLLQAADTALTVDQLTTPDEDNAYDRYRAVLMLAPGNAEAQAGIDEISRRYHVLIENALVARNWAQADVFLERARYVNETDPEVERLVAAMAELRAWPAPKPPAPEPENENEIALDASALASRSEAMVAKLQELARQIRQRNESLLIYARNDAEGRWIYQRMSEAVPGFRLRGDIRLSSNPKVRLLPPL